MQRRDFIEGLAISGILLFLSPKHSFTKFLSYDSRDYIDNKTKEIFNSIISLAQRQKWYKLNINKIIIKIATYLLNSPYLANPLEGDEEICRIDMRGFDCVTLMETCLDMARIIKKQKYSLDDLIQEITYTRYREGKIIDYTSRLHYTADWIFDNIEKKVIEDKTQKIGGIPIVFNLSFMSNNPNYYLSLKNNPELINKIKEIEKKINTRTYYYIPKAQVASAEKELNSGDIIAFVTSKAGLDYSHIGIAIKMKKETRLLHASLKNKKVMIDTSIYNYIKNISTNIGITVLSPLNPI